MSRRLLLAFHGVAEPLRPFDPGEEAVWLEEADFLAILDDIAESDEPIGLTFDDGNASDLRVAAPALVERGLTAWFFVSTDRLNHPTFLTDADLHELVAMGMSIGSHGGQHAPWRGLDTAAMTREVDDSLKRLEDVLQTRVRRVACPMGRYDRRVLSHLRRADVEKVYTSDHGAAREDAWLQPRNPLHRGDGAGTIAKMWAEARSPRAGLERALKGLIKRLR